MKTLIMNLAALSTLAWSIAGHAQNCPQIDINISEYADGAIEKVEQVVQAKGLPLLADHELLPGYWTITASAPQDSQQIEALLTELNQIPDAQATCGTPGPAGGEDHR